MSLDKHLEHVCVVGAGGKMGRGIALLVVRELAQLRHERPWREKNIHVQLIDANSAALEGALTYLESFLRKDAGKRSPAEQEKYPVEELVADMRQVIHTDTHIEAAKDAALVFEAAPENERLKVELLTTLGTLCPAATILSNTSSIPIAVLARAARVTGRLIGFHFYNPPPVQPLVEFVCPKDTAESSRAIAVELGQRLKKVLVPAADIAGFIGNGHFIRDGYFALEQAERLVSELSPAEAVVAINRVTSDWMLRPMGIFQLLDYVGLDVVRAIGDVMNRYISGESLVHSWIADYCDKGYRGGQNSDASQKEGFFRYHDGQPVAVFDPRDNQYHEIAGLIAQRVASYLESPPVGAPSWKDLRRDEQRQPRIDRYLQQLAKETTRGAELARDHLRCSREIGQELVDGGVAASPEHVDNVLVLGFQHLFGPFHPLPFSTLS